jgi:CAAX prenyl protease-like protein
VFPIQTIACGALLWAQRRRVQYRPFAGFGFAVLAGLIALGLWISPQALFGVAPRVDGFDPTFFGHGGWFYWTNLTFRIIRIGLVVPFVEEIFWRGFLLRYLVREDFDSVAFGTFTWRSFSITSVAFCLEHQFQDWPAAVLTGALYNLVAYRTRSLAACIFTHAVTNLALAAYILRTGQWGFW